MDFTTGLLALSFILMLYIVMWNAIALRWNAASAQTGLEASAFLASESLLATPGVPESWEVLPHIDANVSAIGLVNGRNELVRAKLDKLVSENASAYATIKARLGMQRYDFGLRITDLADNIIYYQFGKFSNPTLGNAVDYDRLGILDGNPVIVHVEVSS